MKKIILIIFVLAMISTNYASAHKPISHDDSHRSFDSALVIPDHKISWAIYENLGTNETKFYTFEAKNGDSFYASIVIPKIQGLENYAPTMLLVGEDNFIIEKAIYEKEFPGNEFYEPFGQVTYWERQELRVEIPQDGTYFIVVTDEKNQSGKYSLAVGEIEDFSGENMFTLLPKAWLDTKLFVNDYLSIVIVLGIFIAICSIPVIVIFKKRKTKLKSFS
ncbi:hypothetical protein AAA799B03_00459 [Marine Group I thaumarchaeote SCGC AAA799-B03]|uniref:Uncharacterized protein n=4 Tax=Marine Group I TaxID=905826 RepID=A0A087S860_9ARCH|nr:hypothetical protein AAA799N04_00233 [Marine Group I thaumarchaeote SCGC AAA799-N04]KFM16000.1 hypothetical protein AAA799D11_00789 [Marine Group I thaumarchaeote SCGC AAA799-D11]KFM17737.1 hypothetical protein SCCGRSA3_01667 [Marine Group I thaumarchaeote SCGC RSA3]KFM21914.1 hypothetical protein AAA799B03_00459 [Marine Group I thaumarchaeote SCGC AAA799-B03]